jgi:hypothetical protein
MVESAVEVTGEKWIKTFQLGKLFSPFARAAFIFLINEI